MESGPLLRGHPFCTRNVTFQKEWPFVGSRNQYICFDLHCPVAFSEGLVSHHGGLSKKVPLFTAWSDQIVSIAISTRLLILAHRSQVLQNQSLLHFDGERVQTVRTHDQWLHLCPAAVTTICTWMNSTMSIIDRDKHWINNKLKMLLNGVSVHYLALIDNHGIVRITHCRWRCGLLVTQCPLSLLLPVTYQLLLSMTYNWYCLWRINC